jgi:hypothetical protein
MLNSDANGFYRVLQSVLLFPLHFQPAFIAFAWGGPGEQMWWLLTKRLFLLLPVLALLLACWASIACMITVLIRQDRKQFVMDFLNAWMDLAKGIAAFWAGLVNIVFKLGVSMVGLTKILLLSGWILLQEIVFTPFRLLAHLGRQIATSRIPWIAVLLTLFWCLIEATIFTYVTTPLVVDTFSNITGDNLTEMGIRIPLFIFLLFVVLGSYAVLSTFVDAVQKKSIGAIIGISVIEMVVLFVEVIFLYREFVDALVPWFAQYSENFELGVFSTLAISTFVWFGIRSLSWFLFAEHGTPTIMAVIQGRGIELPQNNATTRPAYRPVSAAFFEQIQVDFNWMRNAADELLEACILPPLQVVTAAINFVMILFSAKPLAALPLRSLRDIQKPVLQQVAAAPASPERQNGDHPGNSPQNAGVLRHAESH